MSEPPGERPGENRYIDTDDLFDKLDQLIHRHQGRLAPAAPLDTVPVLTEAVEPPASDAEAELPVLHDVVDTSALDPQAPPDTASPDRRRQLQVALYLRLRQRIDEELVSPRFGALPAADLAQLAHALRSALPAIVRESVDQVFGGPGNSRPPSG